MMDDRIVEISGSEDLSADLVKVPIHYWEELKQRDVEALCEISLARPYPPKGLVLPFLSGEILMDRIDRCLRYQQRGKWERIEYPLLELLSLVYLLGVGAVPLSGELVSVQELKDSHFFRGPHQLKIGPVIARYGDDPDGFKKAAEALGGEIKDLAHAAYKIRAFPKAPIYYLLWEGDEEFEPRLSVLFDRTIEMHLAADAIWALVNIVSDTLVKAPNLPF
jgi:hypothetical protein